MCPSLKTAHPFTLQFLGPTVMAVHPLTGDVYVADTAGVPEYANYWKYPEKQRSMDDPDHDAYPGIYHTCPEIWYPGTWDVDGHFESACSPTDTSCAQPDPTTWSNKGYKSYDLCMYNDDLLNTVIRKIDISTNTVTTVINKASCCDFVVLGFVIGDTTLT